MQTNLPNVNQITEISRACETFANTTSDKDSPHIKTWQHKKAKETKLPWPHLHPSL